MLDNTGNLINKVTIYGVWIFDVIKIKELPLVKEYLDRIYEVLEYEEVSAMFDQIYVSLRFKNSKVRNILLKNVKWNRFYVWNEVVFIHIYQKGTNERIKLTYK